MWICYTTGMSITLSINSNFGTSTDTSLSVRRCAPRSHPRKQHVPSCTLCLGSQRPSCSLALCIACCRFDEAPLVIPFHPLLQDLRQQHFRDLLHSTTCESFLKHPSVHLETYETEQIRAHQLTSSCSVKLGFTLVVFVLSAFNQ